MTLSGWYRTFFFFLLGKEDDDISLPWCPMSILYLLQFPYAFQLCIENLLLLIHVYIFPQRNFLYSFHIRLRDLSRSWVTHVGMETVTFLPYLSQKTDLVHTVIHSGGNSPVIYSSETFKNELQDLWSWFLQIPCFCILRRGRIMGSSKILKTPLEDQSPSSIFHPQLLSQDGGEETVVLCFW